MAHILKRTSFLCLSLLAGTALWLPCLHLLFRPPLSDFRITEGIAPKAEALAAFHLQLWQDPTLRQGEIEKMRGSNAEWDFMARTYFVLALANMGFRDPEAKSQYLAVMDTIIEETLRLEEEHGILYFLMDYARQGSFVATPARSLFEDGEIALMMGVRRLLEEKPEYGPPMRERIDIMVRQMGEGPVLCAESYPNECWMFCNSVALAAMKVADAVDGTDHSVFFERWLKTAWARLVHKETGLLISSFTLDGVPIDGPEGSSIWMIAHCLQLIDREFARDQYDRARRAIGRTTLGFGYSLEWPKAWEGPMDVDSGPVIPVLGISPGASGLALVSAAAFRDDAYLRRLLTSLNLGGFPTEKNGRLRYLASNPVGDAVMLYAMVQGPVWAEVERRSSI